MLPLRFLSSLYVLHEVFFIVGIGAVLSCVGERCIDTDRRIGDIDGEVVRGEMVMVLYVFSGLFSVLRKEMRSIGIDA